MPLTATPSPASACAETTAAPPPPASAALMAPARVRAALRAHDRLQQLLALLQRCAAQALSPAAAHPLDEGSQRLAPLDPRRLQADAAAGDLDEDGHADGPTDAPQDTWLQELPALARRQQGRLLLPGLRRLAVRLDQALAVLARPWLELIETEGGALDDPADLATRIAETHTLLQSITLAADETLDDALFDRLTHGQRARGDSLQLLLMDLLPALHRLSARRATERVAGAHVWQLADGAAGELDRARIGAWMRGITRTQGLKLDHPGLETAAARDGDRLLLQTDIGSRDARLVRVEVVDGRPAIEQPIEPSTRRPPPADAPGLPAPRHRLRVHCADLQPRRLAFLQQLLQDLGARWETLGVPAAATDEGQATPVAGIAHLQAEDEAALQDMLCAIASRLVFLIDWNRARKRLLTFVDKAGAQAVLLEAARREVGHAAWLAAGGERLLWQAMSDQGASAFHLGDRLDEVLGDEAARQWLVEVLALAARAAQRQQPVALLTDEARLLLARALHGRRNELALLQEHASLCHALAQSLRDGLAHGLQTQPESARALAYRAKAWERQADHLVMRLRHQAEQQPAWQPLLQLIRCSDDVADALEEACFTLSLVAEGHHTGWLDSTRQALLALADAVLGAVQDHAQALALAQSLGQAPQIGDQEAFMAATRRVLQAERRCDELLREARRTLARDLRDAAALMFATELALALERASDHLLTLVHGLRGRGMRPGQTLAWH
ncbi:MAG: hypothetical protein RL223_2685 [Pseudomonadota bacterium]